MIYIYICKQSYGFLNFQLFKNLDDSINKRTTSFLFMIKLSFVTIRDSLLFNYDRKISKI